MEVPGNTETMAAEGGGTWVDTGRDAEPVEASRYLAALRRGRLLIATIVITMTAGVYFTSTLVPETYEARARIFMTDPRGGTESGNVETVERRLATVSEFLTTRQVLGSAAARLRDESRASLEDKVSASVDRDANIVDVKGADADPAGAAAIANAVARSFLVMDATAERRRLARARAGLLRALGLATGIDERRVIREQLSQLTISESAAASLFVLGEPARSPTEASSPRPVRNGVFAFFGAVFLAILAALALDQLAPRVGGGRELTRLTGAPIVAAVPAARSPVGGGIAGSAYERFRSSLALQLPDAAKIVVVSGALPGGPTPAVAAALGQMLADDGSRTLVVSADLRESRIHELLGVERAPGLADILEAVRAGTTRPTTALLEEATVAAGTIGQDLSVLPGGNPPDRPSQLLASEALAELVDELRQSDYRRVVVEGPPLLGAVEGPLVARYADAFLVVCQLDQLRPSDAAEIGELLRRLDVPVYGLVAVGGRGGSHAPSVTPWPLGSRERVEA